MNIQTSELTGYALDWAVDKAEGRIRPDGGYYCGHHGKVARWSTDWSQGGPIIERECINIMCPETGDFWDARKAGLKNALEKRYFRGQTPLVAAMRCYVASKLGDTVDIPEGLL